MVWFEVASSAASPCLFGSFAPESARPSRCCSGRTLYCTVNPMPIYRRCYFSSSPARSPSVSASVSLPITACLNVWLCDLGMEGKKGTGTSAQTLAGIEAIEQNKRSQPFRLTQISLTCLKAKIKSFGSFWHGHAKYCTKGFLFESAYQGTSVEFPPS